MIISHDTNDDDNDDNEYIHIHLFIYTVGRKTWHHQPPSPLPSHTVVDMIPTHIV